MVGFALILNLPVRPSAPPASSLSSTSQSPPAATSPEPAPPASHTIATNSVKQPVEPIAGCQNPEQALTCLPSSSRQVAFADPQAANAVAWENIRNGLSTSQAEAVSIRRGASGGAARLCGIIESNDSSPLGLHLAAVKLNGSAASEGVVDADCAALIEKLLKEVGPVTVCYSVGVPATPMYDDALYYT
jgi:hypothetical protein